MSRPQFNNNTNQGSAQMNYGHPVMQYQGKGVVNGGLIDFQDNSQRGLPAPGEYPVVHQAALLPGVAAPAMLQAAGGVAGNCFSGPPSFIHVSGTTYRPVEPGDPLYHVPNVAQPASIAEAAQAVAPVQNTTPVNPLTPTVSASVSQGGALVNTKILSEAELNRIVDERVRDRVVNQVSGYLSSKPRSYSSGRHHDPASPSSSSVSRSHYDSYEDRVESARSPSPQPHTAERVAHEDSVSRHRYEPRVERARETSGGSRHRYEPRVEHSRAGDDVDSPPGRIAHSGESEVYHRVPRTGRPRVASDSPSSSSTTVSRRAPAYEDDLEMQEAADRVRSANASMSRRIVTTSSGRGGGLRF